MPTTEYGTGIHAKIHDNEVSAEQRREEAQNGAILTLSDDDETLTVHEARVASGH
jgi:hypothetical protein